MSDTEEYLPEGVRSIEVYRAAIECLSGRSQGNPMQVQELIRCVSAKLADGADEAGAQVKSYLIYRDLNSASKDANSKISSRKGAGGGYFLAAPPDAVDGVSPQLEEAQARERTLERHIWPAVEMWLREEKKVSSACCGVANKKSGGVWTNPDVVGLTTIEEMGFFDVEITTVEVKPSLSNWRYFIFEAIAHKRVSDRVYFLFRTSGDSQAEIAEILRYAEKYRIGVVEFQVSSDDFACLPQWSSLGAQERLSFVERFVEHMPAPLDPISVRDKVSFLRQIGISRKPEIYSFGSR